MSSLCLGALFWVFDWFYSPMYSIHCGCRFFTTTRTFEQKKAKIQQSNHLPLSECFHLTATHHAQELLLCFSTFLEAACKTHNREGEKRDVQRPPAALLFQKPDTKNTWPNTPNATLPTLSSSSLSLIASQLDRVRLQHLGVQNTRRASLTCSTREADGTTPLCGQRRPIESA